MDSYANPMACVIMGSFIRVYFTTRTKKNEDGFFTTYITFLDCDIKDPSRILYIHDKPLLEMGLPGTFDEHGTMLATVAVREGKYYMYYMGWQRSTVVPYIISLGLATSDDGVNYTRISDGPVIGLNRFSPFGIGNVSIIIEEGIFQMWYTRYTPWIKTNVGYRPNYDLRFATSKNGIDWEYNDTICLSPENINESLAMPAVKKINGRYHMWFSYRPTVEATGKSGKYRIGYAVSDNKLDWKRTDSEVNLTVSETGWDSDMLSAPEVVITEDNVFMFYCGNDYGSTGFGYAIIEGIR